MQQNRIVCPLCKGKGEDVFSIEVHGLLICPKCQLISLMEEKSPLGIYVDNWARSTDEILPFLRPPLDPIFLANPKLFFLYEDCYYTLLIGRFNASIVSMGVLLEAVMKERIKLKLDIDYKEPYGPCLKFIEEKELMSRNDIKFLKWFKDKIRNPYQHVDESFILQGVKMPIWHFRSDGEMTLEKLQKSVEEANSGRAKSILVSVENIPMFRSIAKQGLDRKLAIDLFNQVYDFLIEAKIKYFKKEEYAEHNRKFGTGLEDVEYYKV